MEDLPPGYRFFPTEEELVSFYLPSKLQGKRVRDLDLVIPVVDIYHFNPSDLPKLAGEKCRGDPEQWFFFIPRQEKEARGGRPNRLTTGGYWKATGSPGYVYSSSNRVIGVKRTMVFYKGRAPTGKKTQWKMNEYRAIDGGDQASSSTTEPPKTREEFSLCRVYIKSKCLRAFDRRPSAANTSGKARGLDQQQAQAHDHQNHPTVERTSSQGSSSSGEGDTKNAFPSNTTTVESVNWDSMAVDNSPLWEWEQFNWI